MFWKSIIISLTLFGLFCPYISAQTSWTFTKTLDLHGKYNVTRWVDMDTKRIDFEVSVETMGFIGFGLSYTGDMVGADIVIGGVYPNRTAYFSDRHATARSTPIIDNHQDWFLISATEGEGVTTLKFYRTFQTCDDQDIPITEDTLKMIWAYGPTDDVQYHGVNRGGMSVNLLDPPQPVPNLLGLGEWDVLVEDEMPAQTTAYWCTIHKRPPEIDHKMYLVGFDPQLVGEQSEFHTHHFTLRKCFAPRNDAEREILESHVGKPGVDCQTNESHMPMEFCPTDLFVWAKGGQSTMFPENVGFPIGESASGDEYFLLEIHYDNPQELQGLRFTTGLKIYYAEEREIEAGLMTLGHHISWGHTIPPNSVNFLTIGHCSSECTAAAIPPSGIKVFNVMLHSHLSGRRLRVRQIRDGKELPWIASDDNYDFNYQQNRPLRQERTVLPGDQLIYECITDTTWKEDGSVTIGDLSTRDEMCEVFFFYYPRVEMDICISQADLNTTLTVLGIEGIEENPQDHNNPLITAPTSMAGMTYTDALENVVKWTPRLRQAFQDANVFQDHSYECSTFNSDTQPMYGTVRYAYVKPYEPEDPCENHVPVVPTTENEVPETSTVPNGQNTTANPGRPSTTVKDDPTSTPNTNSAARSKYINAVSIATLAMILLLLS